MVSINIGVDWTQYWASLERRIDEKYNGTLLDYKLRSTTEKEKKKNHLAIPTVNTLPYK